MSRHFVYNSGIDVTPASRTGWRHRGLVASMTATIAGNLPVFLTGALAVQMQGELGYGDTELGIAVGAYYAAGAVISSSAGTLVHRVGAQRSLRTASALSAVIMALIAFGARSYGVLLLLMVIGGLANSWAQPASNVYLARIVPRERLGVALGLQKSAIPAAALLGGLAVPVAQSTDWRWAFVAGSVFGVLASLWVPAEPAGLTVANHGTSVARPDVATRHLALLAVGVGLGSSASNALSAFVVRGGVEAGLAESAAAGLLTIGSVLGIGVRLLAGKRADAHPGHALRTMVLLFAAASGSFVLLSFETQWVFVIATPLAFATAYAWPGLFHLAVIRSNPSAPGTATGIAMTGTLAGAVAGPVVFGLAADHISFTAAWLLGATFLLGACVIVAVASRHVHEVLATTATEDAPAGAASPTT
jgi:predicted MFS family arabinose efflux permease